MSRHLVTRDNYTRALRDAAARLLAQRQGGDPQQVARGRLTQADADARLRTMRAAAAIWTRIAECADLPPPAEWPTAFGAAADEIAADLARAYLAVRRASDAAPEDAARFDLAGAVAALLFDHQRDATGQPRLCRIHAADQAARHRARLAEAA